MVALAEMLEEGEHLMKRTMDAVRRYHEARDSSSSSDEINRLRGDAETLMGELRDFQIGVIRRIDSGNH